LKANIDRELEPAQMLLLMEAVESAVNEFYEHQGNMEQCIE
jgi:hypothetical protein